MRLHRQTGRIIRRYSVNRQNIYRLALTPVHFTVGVNVLDLGCGYGRFTASLNSVVPPGSRCTGIDITAGNRVPYLAAAGRSGFGGRFINDTAAVIRGFPANSYQLIIAAYSLNYFAEILPAVPHILADDGWFIAITHSDRFLNELTADINKALALTTTAPCPDVDFRALVSGFNAENGVEQLCKYFAAIEKIDYENCLSFPVEQLADCFTYIDFKLPLVIDAVSWDEPDLNVEFVRNIQAIVRRKAERNGCYSMNKNDCIFRCRYPVTGATNDA
ncbi:MAG: class I SAM-dependent methyltransferase [Candidatus Neomarinimicrobiota bacterium]